MKILRLKSSDGVVFEVDQNAVGMSTTLQTMMDTMGSKDEVITLKKFTSGLLKIVVSWMNHHVDDPFPEDQKRIRGFRDKFYSSELYDFDKELLKEMSMHTLFQISLAAHYLEVEGLLTFASMGIASLLKNKNAIQIKETMGASAQSLRFRVTEDMSAEEKETVHWLSSVDEMQVHLDEVVEFHPTACLDANEQLHMHLHKKLKAFSVEEFEWAQKVEEMQPYIDEVIEWDPVYCRRMEEFLRQDDLRLRMNEDREREEREWQMQVEDMQEYIDEIVEFDSENMEGG